MDEEFHIPQTQLVCSGDFVTWNPKVTTLPGLYYISAALLYPLRVAGADAGVCSVGVLRSLQCLYLSAFIFACWKVIENIEGRQSVSLLKLAAIASFPVLFSSSLLFYTDLLSSLLVVAAYAASLRCAGDPSGPSVGSAWFSAFLGLLACFVRQNNIVWVAFIAWTTLLRLSLTTTRQSSASTANKGQSDQLLSAHRLLSIINSSDAWALAFPYLLVGLSAAAFLFWNQGALVVGDREQHQSTFHFAQFGYFGGILLVYSSAMIGGGWIEEKLLLPSGKTEALAPSQEAKRVTRSSHSNREAASSSGPEGRQMFFRLSVLWHELTFPRVAGCLLLCLCVAVLQERFVVEHPYLLADNRHFTFYIWRILKTRFWLRAVVLPPLYTLGFVLTGAVTWTKTTADFPRPSSPAAVSAALRRQYSMVWSFGLLFASALVLMPSPLLEPRYFILPCVFALLQLSSRTANGTGLICWSLILALHLAINTGTLWLFLKRPFIAPDGSQGRFIW